MIAALSASPRFLLATTWVERLGWTLLHFLWQGVLIAKLFAAARGLAGSLSEPARPLRDGVRGAGGNGARARGDVLR